MSRIRRTALGSALCLVMAGAAAQSASAPSGASAQPSPGSPSAAGTEGKGSMQPAAARLEARTLDGRVVWLEPDGTWRYAETETKPDLNPSQMAVLSLLDRRPGIGGCQFHFELNNRQPYEVRSLVFDIKVFRGADALYVENTLPFSAVLPGVRQQRTFVVRGLDCPDIGRLQVAGGDRCDMGELNKFTEGKGLCLGRVLVRSQVPMKFDK